MRHVFADTLYWVALSSTRDQWHGQAVAAAKELADVRIVTSQAVLVEYLGALSDKGAVFRRKAVKLVRSLQRHPGVDVVESTSELFERGLELYDHRPGTSYSLVDCLSMVIMRGRSITEALTHDHHFEQEGFQALLRDRAP